METQLSLEPCRNLLAFSNFYEIDYNICNKYVKNILEYLQSKLCNNKVKMLSNNNFEIRANEFNWSLRITTKSESLIENILQIILADVKCVYLEINKNVYKQTKYKDIMEIAYHPLSFRQADDNIRTCIINYFQTDISDMPEIALICLGGECTLFGKIFYYIKTLHFLTDYQSIYDDLKYNYPKANNNLIDYKTCSLEWISKLNIKKNINSSGNIYIIANTGYHGLGKHLATELLTTTADIIYIVSCNKKSFQNDFRILAIQYNITQVLEITTNYSVYIYKLSKKIIQNNPINI